MFSVIIPAYNAGPYILNSITSVLNQTNSDFEIIIVDDGSVDNTAEVVKSINDPRIRYLYQANAGVSAARNFGIYNARGEYICFLDADDLWKSNHLDVVARLIDKFPTCSVYLTGYEILLRDGRAVRKGCPLALTDIQSDNVYKLIWDYGYFFHTNSIACKKSAFETAGLFAVGVKNSEDDDMWYRLFAHFSAAISGEVTSSYLRENSRATASKIFVKDWIFLSRIDGILASQDVSSEKKEYLCLLVEQRKLSYVRHCILVGDKKTAWKHMKTIDKHMLKKKKYIETLVALFIPSAVSIYFVNKRDKQYYR